MLNRLKNSDYLEIPAVDLAHSFPASKRFKKAEEVNTSIHAEQFDISSSSISSESEGEIEILIEEIEDEQVSALERDRKALLEAAILRQASIKEGKRLLARHGFGEISDQLMALFDRPANTSNIKTAAEFIACIQKINAENTRSINVISIFTEKGVFSLRPQILNIIQGLSEKTISENQRIVLENAPLLRDRLKFSKDELMQFMKLPNISKVIDFMQFYSRELEALANQFSERLCLTPAKLIANFRGEESEPTSYLINEIAKARTYSQTIKASQKIMNVKNAIYAGQQEKVIAFILEEWSKTETSAKVFPIHAKNIMHYQTRQAPLTRSIDCSMNG